MMASLPANDPTSETLSELSAELGSGEAAMPVRGEPRCGDGCPACGQACLTTGCST